jgi:hypothetical protein
VVPPVAAERLGVKVRLPAQTENDANHGTTDLPRAGATAPPPYQTFGRDRTAAQASLSNRIAYWP